MVKICSAKNVFNNKKNNKAYTYFYCLSSLRGLRSKRLAKGSLFLITLSLLFDELPGDLLEPEMEIFSYENQRVEAFFFFFYRLV